MTDEKKEIRTTTIQVSEDVWKELNNRKKLGDDLDDVLRRVLGMPKK